MMFRGLKIVIVSFLGLMVTGCLPDRIAEITERSLRLAYVEEFNQVETVTVKFENSSMRVSRIFIPSRDKPAMFGISQPMPGCCLEYYSGIRFYARSLDRPVKLRLNAIVNPENRIAMDLYSYKPGVHLVPGVWQTIDIKLSQFQAISIENKAEITRLPTVYIDKWSINLSLLADKISPVTIDWGPVTMYRNKTKFRFF